MEVNQPFYNSNYDDPYYNQYDNLDAVLKQQQQAQAAQQGSLGTTFGGLAGQGAGMYAGNQIGLLGGSQAATTASPGMLSGVSGIGAGPLALGALAVGAIANNLYEGGGKDIIKGRGKSSDYANLALNLNPMTAPLNMGLRALGMKSLGKTLFGNGQTTRQVAQENTKNLLNTGKDDQTWQNYVQGMRAQYNTPPTDPSKPFAGKYASWDEYKKAGLDAADLTGVVGNLKAYGPQYAGLSFDQQKALTQKNIDAGNYSSSKGEVNINDEAKAKSFLDELLKAQKK